jgi:hypothetical protein
VHKSGNYAREKVDVDLGLGIAVAFRINRKLGSQ